MKRIIGLAVLVLMIFVVFTGCEKAAPTLSNSSEKEAITAAVIGNNPALANVSIDMVVDFVDTLGKKSDFNDISDNDVLNQHKDGKVDIAITFNCMDKKDSTLSMMRISKTETDSLCLIVRENDKEFKEKLTVFLNEYEKDGRLEANAKRYISSPKDFLNALIKPFKFE